MMPNNIMPNILIRIILTKVIYPSHRSFDTIDLQLTQQLGSDLRGGVP